MRKLSFLTTFFRAYEKAVAVRKAGEYRYFAPIIAQYETELSYSGIKPALDSESFGYFGAKSSGQKM